MAQVTIYRDDAPGGETFDDKFVSNNEDEFIKSFGTARKP